MKKFFSFIGMLFLGLLIIDGISVVISLYNGRNLDSESKKFTDNVLPKICADWSVDTFYQYADVEDFNKAKVDRAKMVLLYDKLKTMFGPMKRYNGSTGEAIIFDDILKGQSIQAGYQAQADFQKGSATIKLLLIKITDKTRPDYNHWEIMRIDINKPL